MTPDFTRNVDRPPGQNRHRTSLDTSPPQLSFPTALAGTWPAPIVDEGKTRALHQVQALHDARLLFWPLCQGAWRSITTRSRLLVRTRQGARALLRAISNRLPRSHDVMGRWAIGPSGFRATMQRSRP